MREKDPIALRVGDVLLGHEGTPNGPCGEMFIEGAWRKITFESNATFLVVGFEEEDDRIFADLVILASGTKVEMLIYGAALGDAITVLRGGRVVPGEECGTVPS